MHVIHTIYLMTFVQLVKSSELTGNFSNRTLSAELQVQHLINLTQLAFLQISCPCNWLLIVFSYHTHSYLFHIYGLLKFEFV